MATAEKIQVQNSTYADNLATSFSMFDSSYSWSVSSGSGNGTHDTQFKFAGQRSLKIVNTDVQNSDLVINSGTQTQFIIDTTGNYLFSWYAFANSVSGTSAINATVQIFISGVPTDYDFTITDTEEYDTWNRYTQLIQLTAGDKITFNVKLKQNAASSTTSQTFYLDGFMCSLDDRNLNYPPRFQYPIVQDVSSENLQNRIIVTQDNVSTTLGGTIDSTKQYFIDGTIDMTGVTITVPSAGIFIKGYNLDLSELICSDNLYSMFIGVTAGNVFIQDLSLQVNGTTSQVFNLTNSSGISTIELVRVNFNNCTAIGELNGYRQGLETKTGRFGGTPEMTFSGTWVGGYNIDTSIVRNLTDGAYTLFKSGTSFSMNSRFRTNQNIDLPASASFLDFSSSNFVNPSTLQINNALISRNGVFNSTDANITPNITQADLKSAWSNNVGLQNTFEGGRLFVSSENVTNIPSGSTYVLLDAVWSTSNLEHFDSPNSGQLRHLGNSPREYKCTVNFSIESTANNDIGIRLRKFDASTSTFIDFSERRREVNSFTNSRDVAFFNFTFNVNLDQNDYVFFQVRNNSGNDNLTLELDSDFTLEER
jgi:hypothetical protein